MCCASQSFCTILHVHQVYARDVTAVSPIALALFGGRLKIFEKHSVVAVEGRDQFEKFSVCLSKEGG